ncbi:MAG: metalloregulator ArsR/SmtB family transcription factor [Candidatus Dormiibacterota bacterium]
MVKYTPELSEDGLSSVFSALADPTRRGILERLGQGEATVSELAQPFDISLPAISRHLKVLEQACLITRTRQAQWRTSSLRTDPLDHADAWMVHLRRLWSARFDRLDAHLEQVKRQSGKSFSPKKSKKEHHRAR